MFILRAVGLFLLVGMALCIGAFILTGNKRYWLWSKRLFRIGLAAAIVFLGLIALERLIAPLL